MSYPRAVLEFLFGNRTAVQILLSLLRAGGAAGASANQWARDLKIPLNMVQKQLHRLERGGVLTSRFQGRARLYGWNAGYPLQAELRRLLKKAARLSKNQLTPPSPDPADGSRLPLRKRVELGDELSRQAEILNPYRHPKPFVKTFASFDAYEDWKEKQKNPWLL